MSETPSARPDLKRVKEIFHEVVEAGAAERERILGDLCGTDGMLRAEVESLLEAEAGGSGFLDSPTIDQAGLAASAAAEGARSDPPESPGKPIGPYKLLQRIGEGGFGVVYMAEQEEPIRRRVALKVIKPGMDTKQVIARFEAERQALAMLDHPNIAKVFDAGQTPAGRPYFVMELVKGIPITEYCDEQRLGAGERLRLFADVCGAVHHAHENGIIHRDIKPSNVLVTLHDGTPVPKVIDFGVAKAIRQKLTESTLFTEYNQFIGTPEYMAPEQAAYAGLDVDRRSDVYSLGALLYELLTGTTPFEARALRRAAHLEVLRILKEEEPPKPSTRVHTMGKSSEPLARDRRTDPSGLARLLRGDLDWIVMKALEKDRGRRYGSASDLADDIGRYFEQRPIVARPPSFGYKARKLLRRRRGPFAAAAVMALLLGAEVTYEIWNRSQPVPGPALPEPGSFEALQLASDARVQVIDTDCGGMPKPSPDGTRLANWNWCEGGVVVEDLSTGRVERVATERQIYTHAWAPDGKRLAVGVETEDLSALSLHVLDLESGEVWAQPEMAGQFFAPYEWSPAGEWVAGGLRNSEHDASTVIVSLESGETRVLTRGVRGNDKGADFSWDGRFVVFSEFDGESEDLFAMEIATGDRWRLTEGPEDDQGALWAPAGEAIVYSNGSGLWALPVEDGRRVGEPRLLNADPVGLVDWTEHGLYYHVNNTITAAHRVEVDPATGRPTGHRETFGLPSPDLRSWWVRWAPTAARGSGSEASAGMPRMAAANSEDRKIHLIEGPNVRSIDVGPEVRISNLWWSPDGREVLFTSSGQAQSDRSLRTVRALDVESGRVRELFPWMEGLGALHVSPDGRGMVAHQPEGREPRPKMIVSDLGTLDGTVVARAGIHGFFSSQFGQPVFSDDGSRIAFQRERTNELPLPEDAEASIWVVDADGSNERKVVGTWGLDSPPLWDPTGRMIAYVESWEDGRRALKVVSLEDGESWEILDMTGMRGVRPQDWSPDGRWIGFTEEVGRHELWIDRDVLEEGMHR